MAIGIIGIDCPTQSKNIGLARGLFKNGKAQIKEVTIDSNDIDLVGTIVEWIKPRDSALIALDAPLGWPMELGKALTFTKRVNLSRFSQTDCSAKRQIVSSKRRLENNPWMLAPTGLRAQPMLL